MSYTYIPYFQTSLRIFNSIILQDRVLDCRRDSQIIIGLTRSCLADILNTFNLLFYYILFVNNILQLQKSDKKFKEQTY